MFIENILRVFAKYFKLLRTLKSILYSDNNNDYLTVVIIIIIHIDVYLII